MGHSGGSFSFEIGLADKAAGANIEPSVLGMPAAEERPYFGRPHRAGD